MRHFLLFLVICVFPGCGQPGPDGFPKTIPFSVTVQYKGNPLENAKVLLCLKDEQSVQWVISGETDHNGVATLRTVQGSYVKLGAPAGSYKVVIKRTEDIGKLLSEEEQNKLSPEELDQYLRGLGDKREQAKSLVPLDVTQPNTTPLTIDIVKGSTETTLNIE